MNPADVPPSLPPHFNFLLGSEDPRLAVQMNPRTPFPSAFERPGAPLGHNDISGDIGLAGSGVPSWNDNHIRLDANMADMEHAVEYPPLVWSISGRLIDAAPGQHLTREIFVTGPLRGLDPTTRYERRRGVDPPPFALL